MGANKQALIDIYQTSLDAIVEPIFIKDLQHTWIICNEAFCQMIGRPRAFVIGFSDPDYFSAEQAELLWQHDNQVFQTGQPVIQRAELTAADGRTVIMATHKYPRHDTQGQVVGLVGIVLRYSHIHEHTEQLVAELEQRQRTINVQRQFIDEVSVPISQIWESVLLVSLTGAIDDRRAQQIIESSLEAIHKHNAQFLLIDITGVPVVDTAVANYLVQTIRAANLLGCQCVLVGIRPHLAHTLVQLGIDFGDLLTMGSLQSGLTYALQHLGNHPGSRLS